MLKKEIKKKLALKLNKLEGLETEQAFAQIMLEIIDEDKAIAFINEYPFDVLQAINSYQLCYNKLYPHIMDFVELANYTNLVAFEDVFYSFSAICNKNIITRQEILEIYKEL